MTLSNPVRSGAPVSLTVDKDITDGFRIIGRFDQDKALVRNGAIVIQRSSSSDDFLIELRDGVFSNNRRALRPSRPELISLSTEGLFAAVEECRITWKEAVMDLKVLKVEPAVPQVGETTVYPFEEAWENPVDEDDFRKLAARLAVAGRMLFDTVFDRDGITVAQRLREVTAAGECVLTVSAPDFHLPWSMLYTHPRPDESLADDGSNFDPRGFWGYQHIVEQFTNDHQVTDRLLPIEGKLHFGAAVNTEISEICQPCLAGHHAFVQSHGGRLAYAEWTTKEQVRVALTTSPFETRIVYFLCHGDSAGLATRAPALHLADGEIRSTDIRYWISDRFLSNQPLVFINACRGGQVSTLMYKNATFAQAFLERGAACMIGPQVEIPALFAGEYGRRFFENLLSEVDAPRQVGPVMRHLAQFFWDKRNPLGLVYSLYAGADCHVWWGDER